MSFQKEVGQPTSDDRSHWNASKAHLDRTPKVELIALESEQNADAGSYIEPDFARKLDPKWENYRFENIQEDENPIGILVQIDKIFQICQIFDVQTKRQFKAQTKFGRMLALPSQEYLMGH